MWPHVFVTHCPGPRSASAAGTLAIVDRPWRRVGPTGEDEPLAGRWPVAIPRGAGRRRPTHGGPPVGQRCPGPAWRGLADAPERGALGGLAPGGGDSRRAPGLRAAGSPEP